MIVCLEPAHYRRDYFACDADWLIENTGIVCSSSGISRYAVPCSKARYSNVFSRQVVSIEAVMNAEVFIAAYLFKEVSV